MGTLITSLGLKQGLVGPLNEEVGPEKCRTQLNATLAAQQFIKFINCKFSTQRLLFNNLSIYDVKFIIEQIEKCRTQLNSKLLNNLSTNLIIFNSVYNSSFMMYSL